jgi:hypothetical protein
MPSLWGRGLAVNVDTEAGCKEVGDVCYHGNTETMAFEPLMRRHPA